MYMLDTDICIYIIKKKVGSVFRQLEKNMEEGLYVSTITLAELEFGNANANSLYKERNMYALLDFLTIINIRRFDEEAAEEYGRIKKYLKDRNQLIGAFDMLIGAHAKSLDMILVTNNVREFERIQGLEIENWVEG